MPTRAVQVCQASGCPNVQPCPTHANRSSRNHYGVSPSRRGYDRRYRADRARLIGLPCEVRLPGCTGTATTADHVIPVALGGSGGLLRPACLHCNSARGSR